MKKLITAGAMLLSMSAFSQSYLILGNGVTLTTDKAGFVYDFGHFILPYKVNLAGGQFLVAEDELITIDQGGFLYRKGESMKKIKSKGANYLIDSKDGLVTIDEKGFFYKYQDEAFKKPVALGGNFLTVANSKKKTTDLYTINSKGNYTKLDIPGLDPASIKIAGGTFFQTNDGVLHTISKDGFVFSKKETKLGFITKVGGNYLINSTGVVMTVAEDGMLVAPSLPQAFNSSTVSKLGTNYFLDTQGRLYVVDKAGNVFERSLQGHDLGTTKILSK